MFKIKKCLLVVSTVAKRQSEGNLQTGSQNILIASRPPTHLNEVSIYQNELDVETAEHSFMA